MAKYEKEIKILNINVEEAVEKLEKLNAEFKGKKDQKIYVYDIPTIFYRYKEVEELLHSENELMVKTNVIKLRGLLEELSDLLDDNKLNDLLVTFKVKNLSDICDFEIKKIIETLSNEKLFNAFKEHLINENKWIRLRQSNELTELTTKHVFNKQVDGVQSVYEWETTVNDFEETNKILESIGIVKKSYQEKRRISYVYKGAKIEIDCWPKLEPYIEVECDDTEVISKIVEELGYDENEIVSENTEQLYKRIGIDLQKIDCLKFD